MSNEGSAPQGGNSQSQSPPSETMSMADMLAALEQVSQATQHFTSVVVTEEVQQHLILLLLAHKCMQRETQPNSGQSIPKKCKLPHCIEMKKIINHMMSCQAGHNCGVPLCSSLRQMILEVLPQQVILETS